FFNNTTQGAMDGNIKDTPPVIFVPQRKDRPRWNVLAKEVAAARQTLEKRKPAARADFTRWLGSARANEVTALLPAEGLRLHADLCEGQGKTLNLTQDGKLTTVQVSGNPAWEAGHVGAKAFKTQPGAVVEIPAGGDFDKGQAFSYGAWVKLTQKAPTGAIFARMDDQHDFRGWDLWLQNGRVGAHIINKWPVDALKVVARPPLAQGQWQHLFVTFDGSGQPAGLKIYINGVAQV